MELQLKNIGMIKEANVKLDGLTVIAGENDTGKSTVGKALFFQLRFISDLKKINKNLNSGKEVPSKEGRRASILPKLIFDNQMSDDTSIGLVLKDREYTFFIKDNEVYHDDFKIDLDDNVAIPILIETPLVWNFNKFFNQMSIIESQAGMFGDELSIEYPFLLKDVHFRLSVGANANSYSIEKDISEIINGEFTKDDLGNFFFQRDNEKISLLNTATGIKYFGLFQVLSQNNYLNDKTMLILDEPEVHLHPKWQLKMAELIIQLVKNGVKVLVNSHSPYIIDALKYYSDESKINSNFYLAEKNKDNNSFISEVTMDISPIFEKLTEPLRELRKMKLGLE